MMGSGRHPNTLEITHSDASLISQSRNTWVPVLELYQSLFWSVLKLDTALQNAHAGKPDRALYGYST